MSLNKVNSSSGALVATGNNGVAISVPKVQESGDNISIATVPDTLDTFTEIINGDALVIVTDDGGFHEVVASGVVAGSTGPIHEVMLANVQNGYTATSSPTSNPPYFAFDGRTSYIVETTGTTAWAMLQLPVMKVCTSYELWAEAFVGREPAEWQLEGSNNGVDFDIIHHQPYDANLFGSGVSSVISNTGSTTPYLYFKLNVLSNAGGAATRIFEVTFSGVGPYSMDTTATTSGEIPDVVYKESEGYQKDFGSIKKISADFTLANASKSDTPDTLLVNTVVEPGDAFTVIKDDFSVHRSIVDTATDNSIIGTYQMSKWFTAPDSVDKDISRDDTIQSVSGITSDAFDGDYVTAWYSGTGVKQLQYNFGVPTAVDIFRFTNLTAIPADSPSEYIIEGSHNDVDWVELSNITGLSAWGAGETRDFTFVNEVAYTNYRITMQSSSTKVRCAQLILLKTNVIRPSNTNLGLELSQTDTLILENNVFSATVASSITSDIVSSVCTRDTGKVYCEVERIDVDTDSNFHAGLTFNSTYNSGQFYDARMSYAMRADGSKWSYLGYQAYSGNHYIVGDRLGIQYDFTTKQVEFFINGVSQGVAFTAPAATPESQLFFAAYSTSINKSAQVFFTEADLLHLPIDAEPWADEPSVIYTVDTADITSGEVPSEVYLSGKLELLEGTLKPLEVIPTYAGGGGTKIVGSATHSPAASAPFVFASDAFVAEEGDLLYVFRVDAAGTNEVEVPGWNKFKYLHTSSPIVYVYDKIVDATLDVSFTTPNFRGTAILVGVRGTTRYTNEEIAIASTLTPACPEITNVNIGDLIFALGCLDDDSLSTATIDDPEYTMIAVAGGTALSSTTMLAYKIATSTTEHPGPFIVAGDDGWSAHTIQHIPTVYPFSDYSEVLKYTDAKVNTRVLTTKVSLKNPEDKCTEINFDINEEP